MGAQVVVDYSGFVLPNQPAGAANPLATNNPAFTAGRGRGRVWFDKLLNLTQF